MSTPKSVAANSSKQRSLVARSTSSVPVAAPEPFTLPFFAGDIIAEKYEVVGALGVGGVAYVISALHLELGEMVALKFLRPESLIHEEVVARFASEARSVARIKSEHVAHVFDVGTLPDGAPFIVMEYLEGKDLGVVLAEQRKLSIRVAVDYVLQACEALACAHATGIVHRDIKPENLFLAQAAASVEVVKVLDFGISKSALGAVERDGRRKAHTMLPMGTPGYMSPEQIRDCGGVDARTDIWALGCVLSELITGTSAFQAPTVPQLTATILERDPIPLCKLMPEAPPGLEALILKCLEKDPDRRFQDVAELAVALYPFGPRRSRVSAERCHHVLNGQQGMVIEFSSVAPPPLGASTPVPVSSTGPVVSAIPDSLPSPEPVRTSTPATITLAASRPPKASRHIVTIAAAAVVTAALGAVLGFRSISAPGAPASGAPAIGAAAGPTPRVPVGAPAVALPPPASTAVQDVASDAPLIIEAPASKPSQTKRASKAKTARPAPVAAKPAPVAAKPAPAASKRRTTLDDSEPDVGY